MEDRTASENFCAALHPIIGGQPEARVLLEQDRYDPPSTSHFIRSLRLLRELPRQRTRSSSFTRESTPLERTSLQFGRQYLESSRTVELSRLAAANQRCPPPLDRLAVSPDINERIERRTDGRTDGRRETVRIVDLSSPGRRAGPSIHLVLYSGLLHFIPAAGAPAAVALLAPRSKYLTGEGNWRRFCSQVVDF
ncbi:unnamed protein product [Xylocopa violacea]|uniref:Uncharacterized protein n=1 Tax=Xylocopa violacea TaxID=135666 RepID=A0ABP1NYD8_XYLVO